MKADDLIKELRKNSEEKKVQKEKSIPMYGNTRNNSDTPSTYVAPIRKQEADSSSDEKKSFRNSGTTEVGYSLMIVAALSVVGNLAGQNINISVIVIMFFLALALIFQ